jgi:hypothetical protein
VSSDNRHIFRAWVRVVARNVLLDTKIQNVLVAVSGCSRPFSDILTWHDVFDDVECLRHCHLPMKGMKQFQALMNWTSVVAAVNKLYILRHSSMFSQGRPGLWVTVRTQNSADYGLYEGARR